MKKMSKEEKRMMFFDMQEHPDKYSDEQVEELLADEEVKEFFHDLAMARMAVKKAAVKEKEARSSTSCFWQFSSASHFSQSYEDGCIHHWNCLPFGCCLCSGYPWRLV